jgi:hypothetical protein
MTLPTQFLLCRLEMLTVPGSGVLQRAALAHSHHVCNALAQISWQHALVHDTDQYLVCR